MATFYHVVVIITVLNVIEVKNTENNSPRYLRVLHLIAYHRCQLVATCEHKQLPFR